MEYRRTCKIARDSRTQQLTPFLRTLDMRQGRVRLNETTITDFSIEIQKLCSSFSLDLPPSHFLASSTLHPVMPACSGSGPSYHRASFGQVLMWTSMCVLCTHSHVEGWVPRVVPCPGDELWVI